ncbi:UNVERIFIED_CONTAM: hypothetical protein FKN15_008312 [Acipenser sinensis]
MRSIAWTSAARVQAIPQPTVGGSSQGPAPFPTRYTYQTANEVTAPGYPKCTVLSVPPNWTVPKEVPTKASAYVDNALKPLHQLQDDYQSMLKPSIIQDWLRGALSNSTQRYYETVSDVLSSVKKMEESLKRLKQARKTVTSSSTGTNRGLSDDNKIRLQLALDVEYLGDQTTIHVGRAHTANQEGHCNLASSLAYKQGIPFLMMSLPALACPVPDWDKAPLLYSPVTPGHTFGLTVDEMLQRSHRAWES